MTAAVSQKGCSQRCCSAGGCRRSRRAGALSASRASPGPAAPLAAEERGSGPSLRATSCGPGRPGARSAQVARLWSRLTMHCHAELRLSSPGQLKAARRRYKTFMIDEILSKETCDYFEKLSLYSVCPSLVVRPKPLHSCTGKTIAGRYSTLSVVLLPMCGRLCFPTREREGPRDSFPGTLRGEQSSRGHSKVFATGSGRYCSLDGR